VYRGRFAEAEEPLHESLELHTDLGVRGYGLHWRTALGQVKLHQGRYGEARALAEQIVAEARDLGYTRGITLGLALLGEVALATGAFAEASRVLTESVEGAGPDATDPYEHGQLAMLGLAARGLGHHLEAKQQMLSALSKASRTSDFMDQMVALVGLSLLQADEEQAERAVELYSLASRHAFVANSAWFQDVVGGTLTAAAAGLSPEALRAARERGAALDLDDAVGKLLAGRAGQKSHPNVDRTG
jgi:tetratricopeptide (TPR) repeat protein